jgi:hypothetical protein
MKAFISQVKAAVALLQQKLDSHESIEQTA